MVLAAENLSARGLTGPLYSGVDLCVGPGECVCITGPTGCGKSTLLRTMAGLHDHGPEGKVLLDGRPVSRALPGRIGLILQNPEIQLFCPDIGSELAFGLENLCVPPADMGSRMQRALSRVGLNLPLDRPVNTLSVGQKYKLLLASVLVMEPSVLLLDEPCAQLDQDGIGAVNRILDVFLHDGGSVIICEHDPSVLTIAYRLHLIAEQPGDQSGPVLRDAGHSTARSGGVVVKLDNAALDLGGFRVWENLDLSLSTGEIAIVLGPNGAGKTSLLRTLTGFLPLGAGHATVFGQHPTPKNLRGKVGLLVQNPSRQLTEDTVLEEVALPLTYKKFSKQRRAAEAKEILDSLNLTSLADKPPFLLSHGQQHLVALASVLAARPGLLLLDDPFVGLDPYHVAKVWNILDLASSEGAAVICALHRLPATRGAHSVYTLSRLGLETC
jgi:energy-coupling factor transport system ATP-binding protein